MPDTAARLRRLLAILAWLAQVGEAPVDEVAARFDLTPAALVAELELAACCGVPPYTPDQLLEIIVTEDTVSARLGPSLGRPRRLSPPEGLALAAAARALLAVPGSDAGGALSRALDKLERALGGSALEIELDRPEHLGVVQAAVDHHRRLAVSYYSASTDQVGDRTIVPHRLFASEGHWYVDAHCEQAGGERRFRLDRIRSAAAVGAAPVSDDTTGGPGAGQPAGLDAFVPGPDSRRVVLAVDPSRAWLLEGIPSASRLADPGGGRERWALFVGGDAWLERLLLRLGPWGELVEPAADRVLGPRAAARLLARYAGAGAEDHGNQ